MLLLVLLDWKKVVEGLESKSFIEDKCEFNGLMSVGVDFEFKLDSGSSPKEFKRPFRSRSKSDESSVLSPKRFAMVSKLP